MDIVGKIDLVIFSFFGLLVMLTNLEAALSGDHVCQKEVIVPEVVPRREPTKQTIRTYQWCLSVPPRCSVYSTKFVDEVRMSVINVTVSIETCCEGFKEQNNICVSMCQHCLNGLCDKGTCICRNGWDGPECDYPLVPTRVATSNASTEPTPYSHPQQELFPFATAVLRNKPLEDPRIPDDADQPFSTASTSSMEYSEVELEGSGSTSTSLHADVAVKQLLAIGDRKEDIFREETGVPSTPKPVSMLMKPMAKGHEEENLILKERYEKRASVENLAQNSRISVTEAWHQNLIYSICAASLISFVVLVTVITLYAVKASRRKIDTKKPPGQEMATVAVYTSSIFHSPLPDPPIFENPSYSSAITRKPNSVQLDGLETQELNLACPKQAKHVKSDVHYLYDHPPSTGSYRASSEVDTLSQYNLSQKFRPISILEPVYDEIPSTVDQVQPTNGEAQNGSDRNTDSNCLYMNTCARTRF